MDGSESSSGARRAGFDIVFPLLLAALTAAAGLLIHLRYYPIGNLAVETDFYADLAVAARRLAAGQFSVLDYPHKGPVYPALLALENALIPDWYRAGVVLNLLFAGASLIVLYRLLLAVFHRKVAAASTIFAASSYAFFVDAHKATSDIVFLFLALGTLHLLLDRRGRTGPLIGAGVMGGLAFLTRYNGAILPIAGLFVLVVINPGSLALRRRVRQGLIFSAAWLCVVSPWIALNLSETGSVLATDNFINVVLEFQRDPEMPNRPREEFTSLRDLVTHDPARFAAHLALNIPRHVGRDLYYLVDPFGGTLFLLGLLAFMRRRPDRAQAAFLVFLAMYAASLAIVFYMPRLRLLLLGGYYGVAFSLVFGSSPSGRPLLPWSLPAWSRRPAAALLLAALLIPKITTIVAVERFNLAHLPLPLFEAAGFLREHSSSASPVPCDPPDAIPGRACLAYKPHLPFLACMRHEGYPWAVEGYGGLLRHAQESGAGFIAIGHLEVEMVPGMPAIAEADTFPGLLRIYDSPDLILLEVPQDLDVAASAAEWAAAATDPLRAMQELASAAEQHAATGDLQAAESALRDAMALAALRPDARGRGDLHALRANLAVIWLQSGRHDEAVDLLESEIRIESERSAEPDPRLRILLGLHELGRGHFERSVSHFEEARSLLPGPGNAEAAAEVEEMRREAVRLLEESRSRQANGRGGPPLQRQGRPVEPAPTRRRG